jgi:hypothetical protein
MAFPFARHVSERGHGHPDGFRFSLNERPNALGWRFDCWQGAPLSVRKLSKTAHFACQLSLMSMRKCSGCTRSGSLKKRGAPRAKHNQRFDGPAAIAKVSVNIKIDVQRVGLNLRKSGLSAAYRARVCWFQHAAAHPDTHAVFPASTLVRCSWGYPISEKAEHSRQDKDPRP